MKQIPLKLNPSRGYLKVVLTVILFIALTAVAFAQDEDKIYQKVDEPASFPDGMQQLFTFVNSNLKYPASALEANVQGRVFVVFVVEKDGNLNDIKVMRGIGSGCDEEAVRVMKASPKWIPAKVNGAVVRSQFTMPISFRLPGPSKQGVRENANESQTKEQAASFPGGMQEFANYLARSIHYPDDARKNNIQGKVFLTFVVEKDGTITDLSVLRGIGGGCDEEAMRVIKESPNWLPGQQNGRVVRSQFTVPISFRLPGPSMLPKGEGENAIYTAVQEQASFPGGIEGFGKYLVKSIRYPDYARSHNIQGRVFITFVIEKDGSLSNITVIRGIGGGCDEEAIRVLKEGPKWAPGKQNGHIVRTQFTVPISFTLNKN